MGIRFIKENLDTQDLLLENRSLQKLSFEFLGHCGGADLANAI